MFYAIQFISEKTLIKHFSAVINAVSISISDPVEFCSKSNPDPVLKCRIWLDRNPVSSKISYFTPCTQAQIACLHGTQ